jgi:signal transduction histidine kinase
MSQLAEFVIVLVGSFSLVLILMGFFFFVLINKYRVNLLKKQAEALNNFILGQDEERQRLARDLHDEMGPHLSNIVFTVDQIKDTSSDVSAIVDETKQQIKKAIKDIRTISHDLMSQSLIKFGLVEAIKEMIERQTDKVIKIAFTSNSSGLEYSDNIKSHLFKITQELVYNSNKHSHATLISLEIMIDSEKRMLVYTYKDNGRGQQNFNIKDAGIGLKNNSTRVELMNGQIEVKMTDGFYSRITLTY